MTLDLQAAVAVARIRLLNWDWVQRSQRYRIEASTDGAVWTSLVDAFGEDHQGWDDWEVDSAARYLRFIGLTNSAGSFAVVSELEVYGPQTWLEVSKDTVNVREAGEGRFFVRLAEAPASNVVVTVDRAAGSDGLTVRSGTTVSGTKAGLLAQLIDGIHDVAGNYGYVVWTNNPPGAFTLDLHAATAVSRIRLLNWDWVYRVHRYQIEGSLDGTNWMLVADASAEDHHGWDDWPVADVAVRYLRFTGLADSANSTVCLAEMEVFGARAAVRRASPAAKGAPVETEPFPVTVVTSDDGPEHTNGWAVVDGDTNTWWQGQSGAGAWYVAVGYDAPVLMTNLVVDAEGAATGAVRCLYSLDGDAWAELPESLEDGAVELNYLWLIFSGEGATAAPQVRELHPQE